VIQAGPFHSNCIRLTPAWIKKFFLGAIVPARCYNVKEELYWAENEK